MSELRVVKVTGAAQRRQFLDLPYHIYDKDPNWVAPLRSAVDKQLAADAPFKQHGDFMLFLAMSGDRAVGRLVASVDRNLVERAVNGRIGFFGFFECEDNLPAAQLLLGAAGDWLRQQGCSLVRGPIDLSTHVNCLFLVDGFDSPPYLLMPYNPPYYASLLERAGWHKAKDAYAYRHPVARNQSKAFERAHQRALAAGISFRPIRLKGGGFEADCRALYGLFTESFSDNWSATTRAEDDFVAEARDLRHIADPNIFPVAEHQGRMVGFWMALPDFNMALRHVRGRLNPMGLMKLLWYRRGINRLRVLAVGVKPEYQRPRFALGPALVHEGVQGVFKRPGKYNEAELSWVWESNRASRTLIEGAGGAAYKTYRIYERTLD